MATTPSRAVSRLQWGRDLSVAECRQSPRIRYEYRSFNGAATFRSRNVASRRWGAAARYASMGPRPFGRGMAKQVGMLAGGGGASMGPRPFGRGMPLLLILILTRAIRFNGAATFRSRNVPRPRYKSTTGACFNGAATFRSRNADRPDQMHGVDPLASMGPRPFGRGMSPNSAYSSFIALLQWGRDLSVAEWAKPSDNDDTPTASMGPRPFGRGMSMPPAHSHAGIGLQWGRDLSVAEWRTAATSRSRTSGPLQWGRDLSVAECGGTRKNFSFLNVLLQWGRDLSVAE